MAQVPPEELNRRTFRFASDAYDFCDDLTRVPGLRRRIGYQLFDAAGSVAANRHEATSAYSRREFAAKNAIALKETREALYWLRLCDHKRLGDERLRRQLLGEADELVAILTVIVRRLQA